MPASSVYDRIFKVLLRGPTDTAHIAKEIGETVAVTIVRLNELGQRGYVTGEGNPMGLSVITDAGRWAAARSSTLPFELLAEKLGQPPPTTSTIMIRVSDTSSAYTAANRAIFACGCEALQLAPPTPDPQLRIVPCGGEHEALLSDAG